MKIRPVIMAASAIVLIQTGPAFAACQDRIEDIREQMQQTDASADRKQTWRNEIDRASRAAQNNNEQECLTVVSGLEEDIGARQADGGSSAQAGQDKTGAQQGLTITQPQPNVRVQEGAPDITITQPAPDIRVESQEPDVSVDVPKPRIEGRTQADVQVEGARPDVTYQRTGEAEITYGDGQGPQQGQQQKTGQMDRQQQQPGEMQAMPGRDQMMENETNQIASGEKHGQSGQKTGDKTVSDVSGMQLRNRQGQQFGQIDDVTRDRQTGQAYVIISSGGFMGFGEEQVAVPLSELEMQEQFAVIDIETREQLNQYEYYDEQRFEEVDDNQSLAELQKDQTGSMN
ncbi:MAG: PRC-barrel domain containing protein [Alphaproteobacteria bacterium]|nr:PRC-barrel domain containing protein [Alphaproteobacteria bacterium]